MYKAEWDGVLVAVKIIVIPAGLAGEQKAEKMALMELAISGSLAHPNIVQTYTCEIRPILVDGMDEGKPSRGGWMDVSRL